MPRAIETSLASRTPAAPRSNHSLQLFGVACMLALGGFIGCAGYSPKGLQPGQPEADVVAQMGRPTGRYKLPDGGTRLEFARGPAGRETYMVDFDAAGKMTDWEQVMDLWYLTRISPGLSVDDVLMRVGHPATTFPIPRQQLVVWNYRYPTNNCLWFQISIGDDGKVISGAQGIDPQCDAPSDARGGIGGGMGVR